MGYSRKLGPPIVAASVSTLVLTNFATLMLVTQYAPGNFTLFRSVWPILLTSSTAIILVMSFLYRSLVDLVLELERREASAQHQAVHDALTGLGNRALLEDRLENAVGRYVRDGERFSLLMLDLDRFKLVNDTFGHAAGDALVLEIADRLRALTRETDAIARIGGDEFAIVQSRITSEADVRHLCQRIVEAVREPLVIRGKDLRVGASVGAVIIDDTETSPSELIRKADITMYRAKSLGRNCYQIFCDEMDTAVQRRNVIERKLREALPNGRSLELHYQPQLDASGEIRAVEGLLRWRDRELGSLSPAEVIPVAEESGLIQQLGEHTFRLACRAAAQWPSLAVAVNVSPLEFRSRDLPARLRAIAAEEAIECSRIELEITENILIQDADFSEAAIRKLRDAGFSIALDDFGTGYSSLSYLRRFPVDKIKLDRSFIESAQTHESIAIIEAAVRLGHALGLSVVAEGISSAEQQAIALAAGCDAMQGFFYAAAMRPEEIEPFVSNWRAPPRIAAVTERRPKGVAGGRS
jgi:diguanylate cyclase (GGDEF)-like protein